MLNPKTRPRKQITRPIINRLWPSMALFRKLTDFKSGNCRLASPPASLLGPVSFELTCCSAFAGAEADCPLGEVWAGAACAIIELAANGEVAANRRVKTASRARRARTLGEVRLNITCDHSAVDLRVTVFLASRFHSISFGTKDGTWFGRVPSVSQRCYGCFRCRRHNHSL